MRRSIEFSLVLLVLVFLIGAVEDNAHSTTQKKRPPKPGPPSLKHKKEWKRELPGPTSVTRPTNLEIGTNIRVNTAQLSFPDGLLGRSETAIAASASGKNLLAGWNDVEGFLRPPFGDFPGAPGLSGFGFSTDGGQTWTDAGAPPLIDHLLTAGDPWLDRGGADEKTFYYSNLAVDIRDPFGKTFPLGISVHRGRFKNKSFTWNDVRLIQSPNYPRDIYDKGVLSAAKDGSGKVYLVLTNFKGVCSSSFGFGQIELWRSHDSGDTWKGPSVIAPDQTFVTDTTKADCGLEGLRKHNPMPAAGVNGEVYVIWSEGPTFTRDGVSTDAEILVARSGNGGESFGAPVRIARINSVTGNPPVGYDRGLLDDIPQIAVVQHGRNRGRVIAAFYSAATPVTYAPEEQNLVSMQIYVSYSDDQGRTWSKPTIPVGSVPPTGVKQFWPTISITADGTVNLIYYRSEERQVTAENNDVECEAFLGDGSGVRRGPASSLVDTMWVSSGDGGVTFSAPVRVSSATSNWCNASSNMFPTFGDYIGSASGANRVFALWVDSRAGVPDVFFSSIFSQRTKE